MAEDRLVYIVGEPGAGKSTLMAALTEGWERHELPGQPKRDLLIDGTDTKAVELGRRRPGGFSGTDALSSTVINSAEPWLFRHEAPLVLGEGARLGNARFLSAAVQAGYETLLVLLDHSEARRWRTSREAVLGRQQNPTWVKGRRTASLRLAESPPAGVHVLRGHPDDLLPRLRTQYR